MVSVFFPPGNPEYCCEKKGLEMGKRLLEYGLQSSAFFCTNKKYGFLTHVNVYHGNNPVYPGHVAKHSSAIEHMTYIWSKTRGFGEQHHMSRNPEPPRFCWSPQKNTRFFILNPLDLYKGLGWFRPQGITRYHKCMMDYDGMYIYTILYHTCFITSASTKGQSSLVVSNDSYWTIQRLQDFLVWRHLATPKTAFWTARKRHLKWDKPIGQAMAKLFLGMYWWFKTLRTTSDIGVHHPKKNDIWASLKTKNNANQQSPTMPKAPKQKSIQDWTRLSGALRLYVSYVLHLWNVYQHVGHYGGNCWYIFKTTAAFGYCLNRTSLNHASLCLSLSLL